MPSEADLVLVLGDQGQEPGELPLLPSEVRVQQGLVALAPAPQHVIGAVEPLGGLEHQLHLRRRVGEHLRIGIRGRARGVAGMAEEIRGAPQELRAGPGHVGLDLDEDHVEVRPRFGERPALRRDVAIVEAKERDAELRDELEGGIELGGRGRHRVETGVEPGPVERADAEDI